jgi:hypothetical protein
MRTLSGNLPTSHRAGNGSYEATVASDVRMTTIMRAA